MFQLYISIGLRTLFALLFINICSVFNVQAQPSTRINHQGNDLFISGSNVAWINFARDIGPGTTKLDEFEIMFKTLRNHGGNSMRLWLHTSGASTPQWSGNLVVGPGEGAINDLKQILDLAYNNDISLMLCLWSFDMLRESNGASVTDRNMAILTQPVNRQSYMEKALKPMVEALKEHPAILAWEIFNEAEGMSNEFGWSGIRRVSMQQIQAFVNQATGTIKRADPKAKVTTGAWAFKALSDVQVSGSNTSTDKNYYRDDRLKSSGGDTLGILDFYTVHYYDWAGTSLSPFHNDVGVWKLDKPVVVAEFYAKSDIFGVSKTQLFQTLRTRGYAGALSWQWVDWAQNRENNAASWPNTLVNMKALWNSYPQDVDLSYTGLKASFTSPVTSIETGTSTWLKWDVRGAVQLNLNGNRVAFLDSLQVTPTATTEYTLSATDRKGVVSEKKIKINVLQPSELNRSIAKKTFSDQANANAVSDENTTTLWTSPGGRESYVYIDLDASYDINKIILRWGNTRPSRFTIAHSFDAVNWTTFHSQSESYSTPQTLNFTTPIYTRFLRFSTSDAAQLAEFETYGLLSSVQRFKLDLIRPTSGDTIEAETPITLEASLVRRAGAPISVRFYVNGELKGNDATPPYTVSWTPTTGGNYTISAQITDGSYEIYARPIVITILSSEQKRRYEAESAVLGGSLTKSTSVAASGGQYVVMENDGSITWNNVSVLKSGTYTLRVGYYLPFDYKEQYLKVNNGNNIVLPFRTPTLKWVFTDTTATLTAGNNTITLSKFWGYMWIDYLEVRGNGQYATSIDEDDTQISTYRLYQNYPNPFNPVTTISYQLPGSSSVMLEFFDITGKKIRNVSYQHQPAGTHQFEFDASTLSSGVYLYRLRSSYGTLTQKMVLLK